MNFLLNDVVLSLDLRGMTPPMVARQFHAVGLDAVIQLGREMFAEDPRLQHHAPERARRLAGLIVSKAPGVNAALFVVPRRGCKPAEVAMRLVNLDMRLMARVAQEQQAGLLTPVIADEIVWSRLAAA